MNYVKHMAVGIFLMGIVITIMNIKFGWYQFNDYTAIFWLIGLLIISPLIPDLDQDQSKIHRAFIGIGIVAILIGVVGWYLSQYGQVGIIGYYWLIPLLGGLFLVGTTVLFARVLHHRGFIHSVAFCFIYGIFVFFATIFNYQLAFLAFIGAWSHLIADGEVLKMV